MPSGDTIWTIGHSTRTIGELIGMLEAHGIGRVADVRQFPMSRRHPQFNQDQLREELEREGIGYVHLPGLGGRRRARADSRNTAWRNEAFRGYADYMETPEYRAAAEELLRLARERPTAMMCAEAVWWRCHRGLISDDFKSRGVEVLHIVEGSKAEEHPYTSAAKVVGGKLSYQGDGLFDAVGEG